MAQAELIRRTLDKAGVDARTVSYVEAHGTGTALGDPIEVEGLTQAFRADTADNRILRARVGQVEHRPSGSGRRRCRPRENPAANATRTAGSEPPCRELNPNIDFDDTPFRVQQRLGRWDRPVTRVNGEAEEHPRIACLSSFGAGGANAHLVVEEYPARAPASSAREDTPVCIVLSARDEDRLSAYVRDVRDYLAAHRERLGHRLRDIAHTLQIGREAMVERLALRVSSFGELLDRLDDFLAGDVSHFHRGRASPDTGAPVAETAMNCRRPPRAGSRERRSTGSHCPALSGRRSSACRHIPSRRRATVCRSSRQQGESRGGAMAAAPVWDAVSLPQGAGLWPGQGAAVAVIGANETQLRAISPHVPARAVAGCAAGIG